MGRKANYSFETKIDVVLRCLSGKTSTRHEASLLGIDNSRVREWISLYQALGEAGLITTSKNTVYSTDTKRNAVLDYINGDGSHLSICKKYGIRSTKQLRDWILKYNGHEELKASGTGGKPMMTKGRKPLLMKGLKLYNTVFHITIITLKQLKHTRFPINKHVTIR